MRYALIASFIALAANMFAGEPDKPATPEAIAGWVKIIREHDIGMHDAYDGLTAAGAPALATLEAAIKTEKNPKAKMMLERAAGVVRTRDVVRKMIAAVAQAVPMEYTLEATIVAGPQKIQAKSRGAFPNDGKRFRIDSTTTMSNMNRRMLQLGTGEKLYIEHSVLGADGKPTSLRVQFMDMNLIPKGTPLPQSEIQNEIARVVKDHDIYAVEETKQDGVDVLVLKAVSRVGRDMSLTECKHFGSVTLRKSDYMPIRSEETTAQGSQDIRFTSVKLNATIDPALLEYTPPKGAEIEDLGARLRGLK